MAWCVVELARDIEQNVVLGKGGLYRASGLDDGDSLGERRGELGCSLVGREVK